MASISYPRPGYNGGFINNIEQERLLRVTSPEGVYGYPTDTPVVYADGTGGRVAKIRAGKHARVRASFYDTGPVDFAMPPLAENTSGQPRIDLIVARLDRAGGFVVKEWAITGVPAAQPVTPSWVRGFGDADVYDIPLARVRVENGANAITADKVTPLNWWVGDDGQIRCTSTTRPLHQAGRTIWEHDTGRQMFSDGTNWRVLFEDTGQLNMTQPTGWGSSANFIRRRSGIVTAALSVTRTGANVASNSVVQVATIPDGFRPPENFEGPAYLLNSYVMTATWSANGAVLLNLRDGGFPKTWFAILAPASWAVG